MVQRSMMQGELVSLESDISGPIAFLKELGGREKTVLRNILSGIGTDAKSVVKRSYRTSGLKKDTGSPAETREVQVGWMSTPPIMAAR